jgi:xanthine dehydrogenase YagR molybdenum-binding subunit
VAAHIGWDDHPNRIGPGQPDADGWTTGIGFGVATWRAGGSGGSECEVRIFTDGSVTSSIAVQDLGTGSRTYVAAIPAEELGLPLEAVSARIGDSDLPPSVGSGGSVTTGSVTPAILNAAHAARTAMEERLQSQLGVEPGSWTWKDGKLTAPGVELTFREACAMLGSQPVVGRGSFEERLTANEGRLHGAQAVKVRVDTLTGRVELLDMVAIQDQGIPMNRLACRSQINGGMIQALSFGMLEERVVDPDLGLLLTGNMETYRIAGCREIPRMTSILDDDDPRHGVTGMAEAPVIPGHAALANAIANACGARLRSLPFTPDRVLAALAERPAGGGR